MDEIHEVNFQIALRDLLLSSGNILLVSDQRADGDSLGSVAALSHLLSSLGKKNMIFVARSFSPSLQFLVEGRRCIVGRERLDASLYDMFVCCDFGGIEQSGIPDILEEARQNVEKHVVVIDHHVTNTRFGNENYVVPSASATTEILYDLFIQWGWKEYIDRTIARYLLTGLVTDTGNFSNAATTPHSMQVAAQLMNCGADLGEITRCTWKNKSVETLKLWGKILFRLRQNLDLGMAITLITRHDLEEANLSPDAADGVANFLNTLSQADSILVLREEQDEIKGSLRTTKNDVDVSKIARFLGGGGHTKAAGFSLRGHLLETGERWRVV